MPKPAQESESIFDDLDNPVGTGAEGEGEEQPVGEGAEGGASAGTEGEGEQPAGEALDFEGLPFKDIQALVKGYKDLQSRATKRDQEFLQTQAMLKELLPRLPKQAQQEVKEDPEAFVKAFVQNPREVLANLIKQALEGAIKTTVEPLQGEIRGLSGTVELQRFLEAHPELEDGDEEFLLEMMERYPEVGSRKDRLEIWLMFAKSAHPEIQERMTAAKANLEKGATDAKKAASLGGKKSSTPAPAKDEFDEVIDLWKERRKFWERD